MFSNLLNFISQFTPLLLTVILASSSYWLALQSELNLFGQKNQLPSGVPDYYFTEFKSEEIRLNNNQTLILSGIKAEHFPESDSLVIERPKAVQKLESNIRSEITARSGVYQIEDDQLTLTGQVMVSRVTPETTTQIRTEQLVADGNRNTLISETMTQVEQPGRAYRTDSFEYDNQTGEFSATGRVNLKLEPSPL